MKAGTQQGFCTAAMLLRIIPGRDFRRFAIWLLIVPEIFGSPLLMGSFCLTRLSPRYSVINPTAKSPEIRIAWATMIFNSSTVIERTGCGSPPQGAALLDASKSPVFRYKSYSKIPGDKNSLGNNDIQFIHRDRKNRMWLATSGGGFARRV